MKTLKNKIIKTVFPAALLLITMTSCERELSDDLEPATFPNTAEIFTDAPVGLTDQFFRSFDPIEGANVNGFGVDNITVYEGSASIRIDVPASNDPDGGFIGGVFEDRGDGRNLTGYDALTFWAKGTTSGSVLVGFGTDFDRLESDPSYDVLTGIQLSTGWKKYIIPMPDPSKLVQEKGMFLFSAGGFDPLGDGPNGNEIAWTFWIDELKFEKLGTTRLLYPYMLNGQDVEVDNFTGSTQTISGLGAAFNLPNGQDIFLTASSDYFDFTSSDPSVATVMNGEVSIIGAGTTTITGNIASNQANGSLTINSTGSFVSAPDPTLAQTDVVSIYSDTYTGVTGFNPGVFAGPNTTNISIQTFNGNSHLNFESIDFLGMGWDGTVNVTGETMFHADVQLVSAPGSSVIIELLDFGPDDIDNGFGDGSAGGRNISNQLVQGQWISIDIPLNGGFSSSTGGGGSGNPNLSNIGNIILVSTNGASFLVDNIYFY